MLQQKPKQITKFEVKLVGGHPLIFTFLSMALCGALCYTENSSTAKLDFEKRHRDWKPSPTAFSLCTITAPFFSLQVVLFLVSLSLCIGFSGDFPGRSHP